MGRILAVLVVATMLLTGCSTAHICRSLPAIDHKPACAGYECEPLIAPGAKPL